MQDLAIGRKAILKAFGVAAWTTICDWRKADPGFRMILRRMPSGKPFIFKSEAMAWLREYDNANRIKKAPKKA